MMTKYRKNTKKDNIVPRIDIAALLGSDDLSGKKGGSITSKEYSSVTFEIAMVCSSDAIDDMSTDFTTREVSLSN